MSEDSLKTFTFDTSDIEIALHTAARLNVGVGLTEISPIAAVDGEVRENMPQKYGIVLTTSAGINKFLEVDKDVYDFMGLERESDDVGEDLEASVEGIVNRIARTIVEIMNEYGLNILTIDNLNTRRIFKRKHIDGDEGHNIVSEIFIDSLADYYLIEIEDKVLQLLSQMGEEKEIVSPGEPGEET